MDVDLRACVDGDKRAWDRFVERYARVIVAAVRRAMQAHGAGGEIEDPVQEVFLRLVKDDFRLLRSYDPGRAALTTWLTLVARSVTIDQLRKRRPEGLPLDEQRLEGRAPPPDPVAPPEIPVHLLTGRQRLVLRLLFDEERSVAEAAVIVGVDEQTIRSTKHKAIGRLREHYRTEASEDSAGMNPRPAP
jgi:RNA polymerase sigma-70 factor (ECF subfamily)